MKIEARIIKQLLQSLSDKTGLPQNFSSFQQMSERIGKGISEKYLYNTLYKKVRDEKDETMVNLQDGPLNTLAAYVGYKHLADFQQKVAIKKDPVLDGLIGNYYSYVRRSDEVGVILRSPVTIYVADGGICFELHGPKWKYEGKVRLTDGTLYILMQAPSGKEFHHVYKIGKRERPNLLKGVFSGVSTTFEPIGGRVVLIREEGKFDELKAKEISVKELRLSKNDVNQKLAGYFEKFSDNNLIAGRVVTFEPEDLASSS